MDISSNVSHTERARMHRGGPPLVLVCLEPRSYSGVIGGAIAQLRPELDTLVVEPEELSAEVECRAPSLVLSASPRPAYCDEDVRWAEFRPYDEPDVVYVDGRPHRFLELDLWGLLEVVDHFCGDRAHRTA